MRTAEKRCLDSSLNNTDNVVWLSSELRSGNPCSNSRHETANVVGLSSELRSGNPCSNSQYETATGNEGDILVSFTSVMQVHEL
jgi:hypothetical protein